MCWQTDEGVDGQYFICLLYRDVLCLASAGRVDPIYTIMACINIDEIRIEEVDNGRGKQRSLTREREFNSLIADDVQDCNATLRPFLGNWYLNAIISYTS